MLNVFVYTKDVCCPYGLVFGGTDVNEYRNDPHCKDVMLQAITNARCSTKK